MTSATTQEIDLTICAHVQLLKVLGQVEAEIASTVMKDNNCASGKEGINRNDQTDNHTTLCTPKDLFLVLAHIESELARTWLQTFNGKTQFPWILLQCCLNIMCPKTTMGMHHMLRLTASNSWIRLEPEIS